MARDTKPTKEDPDRICHYCGASFVSRPARDQHEKYCPKNPNNIRLKDDSHQKELSEISDEQRQIQELSQKVSKFEIFTEEIKEKLNKETSESMTDEETKKQDRDRRIDDFLSKDEERKRLADQENLLKGLFKRELEPYTRDIEGVKGKVDGLESTIGNVEKGIKEIIDCKLNPNHPECVFKSLLGMKPKEEKPEEPVKPEKKPESKPPESQIISDKDRRRMAEADKWLDFAEPLRDKRPERVTTAVVTAARNVFNEVAKSEPNTIPELVQSISPEIIQEIRKGLVAPKSMSDEEGVKLNIERCQDPNNSSAFCKLFRDQGFHIQKKRQGGMLGSPWEDIK